MNTFNVKVVLIFLLQYICMLPIYTQVCTYLYLPALAAAWHNGHIVSASRSKDPVFESRQSVLFLGLNRYIAVALM
jgi:hypothetical protein